MDAAALTCTSRNIDQGSNNYIRLRPACPPRGLPWRCSCSPCDLHPPPPRPSYWHDAVHYTMHLIAPAASVLRRIVFVAAQRRDAHNAHQSAAELRDLIPLNEPEEEEEVGKPSIVMQRMRDDGLLGGSRSLWC